VCYNRLIANDSVCSFEQKSFFSMHYYEFFKLFLLQWEWEWEGIRITFRNKRELEYSQRFPKARKGNGNEVMGMGGNGYTKIIPTHLYVECPVSGRLGH